MPAHQRTVRCRAAIVVAAGAALLAIPSSASAAVSSAVAGGKLTITTNAGDAVAVTCAAGQAKVNGADPGTGAVTCAALTAIDITGDAAANAITLTGVTAADFPAIATVEVDGGDGADTISGSGFADALEGGPGNDRIVGDDNPANTRDAFLGQAGDDTLVWNPGDDDDTMDGGDGTDVIEVNGGGGPEQFITKPSATPGRVSFDRTGPTPPGPFNLDIATSERLDLNAAGGNDTLAADDGLLALGITLDYDGGDGDDRIEGADSADVLTGGPGRDIVVSRDRAADLVDCGTGLDLARVDRRDFLRGCDIVIGGGLRVRLAGGALDAERGRVAVALRCVATERCRGVVRLRRGDATIGSARFDVRRDRSRTVRVRLTRTGKRLVARSGRRGIRIAVEIDARDRSGNGWRTTSRRTLRP